MKKSKFVDIICFLFIVLFIYAAGSKLLDYTEFVMQIAQSPLLTNFADILAWMVPGLELIIAFMLMTRWRLVGLYASFTLMVLFTAYIIAILQLGRNIPCSCGGVLDSLGWTEHLIFNIVFVLLGLTGVLKYRPDDGHLQEENNVAETDRRNKTVERLAESG